MHDTKNETGLAHTLIIGLLAVAIIGGAGGWYVWHRNQRVTQNQSSASAATPAAKASQPAKAYTPPAGATTYRNEQIGFQLSYPSAYGTLKANNDYPDAAVSQYLISTNAPDTKASHISGDLKVTVYASSDQAIQSRKYGPTIKLQNNAWVVTAPNPAEPGQKAGDAYIDTATKAAPAKQSSDAITVYTLANRDEGGVFPSLVFVYGKKLIQVQLPTFDTGTFGTSPQPAPYDQADYDQLVTTVRDSIRPIR